MAPQVLDLLVSLQGKAESHHGGAWEFLRLDSFNGSWVTLRNGPQRVCSASQATTALPQAAHQMPSPERGEPRNAAFPRAPPQSPFL